MKDKIIKVIKIIDKLFEDTELHNELTGFTVHLIGAKTVLEMKLGEILVLEALK